MSGGGRSFTAHMRARILEHYPETRFFPAPNASLVCFINGWEVLVASKGASGEDEPRLVVERMHGDRRKMLDMLAFCQLFDWKNEWLDGAQVAGDG